MRIPKEYGKLQTEAGADLIDKETLYPVQSDRPARTRVEDSDDVRGAAELDDAPVPQITRMPEGMTVVEQQIGHALGQWVFVIVCDCGRRWFALEAQQTAHCPRCERWVQIDAKPRKRGL